MATSSTTTSSNLHIVVQAAGAAPPCTGPWTAAGAGPPVPRFRLRLPHAAAPGMGQGPATPLTSSASSVQDGVDLTGRGEQHASVAYACATWPRSTMLLVASAGAVPSRHAAHACQLPQPALGDGIEIRFPAWNPHCLSLESPWARSSRGARVACCCF